MFSRWARGNWGSLERSYNKLAGCSDQHRINAVTPVEVARGNVSNLWASAPSAARGAWVGDGTYCSVDCRRMGGVKASPGSPRRRNATSAAHQERPFMKLGNSQPASHLPPYRSSPHQVVEIRSTKLQTIATRHISFMRRLLSRARTGLYPRHR
jgi:hypothetical protein